MLKIIILAVALVVAGGTSLAADGSLQKDPLWRYSDTSAKQNLILRHPGGRWVEYWVRDPILENNWIRFKKDRKVGVVVDDPIIDGRWLIFDSDPVGE